MPRKTVKADKKAAAKAPTGTVQHLFIYILTTTGIVKQTRNRVAEKASPEVPKRTLGGQKLGAFFPTAANLTLEKLDKQTPSELDDQEMPAKTQTALDKELPEIVLICQREDTTAKKMESSGSGSDSHLPLPPPTSQ